MFNYPNWYQRSDVTGLRSKRGMCVVSLSLHFTWDLLSCDSLLHSPYFHRVSAYVIGRLVRWFLLPFLNGRLSGCNLIQHETTYWSRQLRPSRNVYASPKMVYVSQDANASCASGTLVPSSCMTFRLKSELLKLLHCPFATCLLHSLES